MGKYNPLATFLAATPTFVSEATFSFGQIEQIIGAPLPWAAYEHRQWWENEATGRHVQARAWMNAGWRVSEVDQTQKWVRFRRAVTSQRTSSPGNDHLLSFLENEYKSLRKIAAETFRSLGEEQAMYFINLANDWIDILSAVLDTCSKDELSSSLMYIYLSSLLKEVRWFQLLFFSGNYPLLHRNLRFVWEMIFRAYYVDTYSLDAPEPPGPTIDDKVEWLAQHERKLFKWDKFVKPTLRGLLPQVEGTEMEEYYHLLWDKLNEYVHPSKALLDRMVVGVPGFLMTDSFDKEWVSETIEMATMIFDLVWVAVISRFPSCAELIAQKGLLLEYPIVTAALGNF